MNIRFFLYPFRYTYYFISYALIFPLLLIQYFLFGLYIIFKYSITSTSDVLTFLLKKAYNIIFFIMIKMKLILYLLFSYLFYVFRLFFCGLKFLIKNLFMLIGKTLKLIIFAIGKTIKITILIITKTIKIFLLVLSKIFRILLIIIKKILIIIKKIIKITTLIITQLMKIVILIIRSFFTGVHVIFNSLYKYISISIRFIIKALNLMFGKIIKYIIYIIKMCVVAIKKLLSQALIIIINYIKIIFNEILKLYNQFVKLVEQSFAAVAYVIKNYKAIIKNAINKVIDAIKDSITKIKQYFINWYNSFAFVKYLKNKSDFQRKILLIDFSDENIERSDKKTSYRYVAKNIDGKIVSGYFDAYSKIDVHSFLMAEGSEVYKIETSKYIQYMASLGKNNSYRISYKDLAFALTQLATYIKAGIPLVDSIKILAKQTRHTQKKKIFESVIYEIVMGATFSESLEKQGPAFPRLLINMVKTSEMTGQISDILEQMAIYYDSAQKTRSQMISAMVYPIVVFFLASGVITFVMIFIVPRFVEMFRNMEKELPWITLLVINTSDFLQNNILYLFIGFIILIVIFKFLFSSIKAFRYIIQWLLMHMPVMGKIIIYNEVTMFAKTFGSLLTHNVFITDSMEILSKITNNEIYKFLIFDTISNLGRGELISRSFRNHWAFPIIAYEMLVTGERTGEVGMMMNKVGDYYSEQHKLAISQVKTFIEPIMIIFLALIVGVILLAIIIPMFSMYQQF